MSDRIFLFAQWKTSLIASNSKGTTLYMFKKMFYAVLPFSHSTYVLNDQISQNIRQSYTEQLSTGVLQNPEEKSPAALLKF